MVQGAPGLVPRLTALRTFQRYREQFGFLPGAWCVLIRQPAQTRLPLEDNSVDVVVSCALYNHLRKVVDAHRPLP